MVNRRLLRTCRGEAAHCTPPATGVQRVVLIAMVTVAAALGGCNAAWQEVPRVSSQAFDGPATTPLGQAYGAALAATAAAATGDSGLHLLVAGPEAFAARAALAEAAQQALDLQYYIVAHDSTSTLLMEAVLRAAQRGVRVRVLVDDLNIGRGESDLALLDAHPNLEVRLFNPFALRGTWRLAQLLEWLGSTKRLDRRMHNKLWVADGAVAVLGGRNLSDAYFSATQRSDFADLDVLVAGPAVAAASRSFDAYWNSDAAVPLAAVADVPAQPAALQVAWAELGTRARRLRESDYIQALRATAFGGKVRQAALPLVAAPAQVLADAPMLPSTAQGADAGAAAAAAADAAGAAGAAGAATSAIFPPLRHAVEQAQHEVTFVTPYFVPGPESVQVLCILARRGVRVRILTNSLASTDVPVVHAGYARHRPQLLACGVALHELRPQFTGQAGGHAVRIGLSSGASLHAKAVVVDGRTVFIGSMNLDPRSRGLNTEIALRIDSPALGTQLERLFDDATALDQAFRAELEGGDAAAPVRWVAMEDGRLVRYADEPLASAWRRWVTRLLWGLAPESLL